MFDRPKSKTKTLVERHISLVYDTDMVSEADHFLIYCEDHRRIEEILAACIQRQKLLHGVTRLGLAVSGGADSVALFHLMAPLCHEAGIDVSVLHLNHGLRAESEEEEQFVKSLAAASSVPFYTHHAQLSNRPADGRSLEMAARTSRMDFFQRCCKEAGLDAVATGHQADDVAETLLLRLARGAGAAGLSGLRPHSKTGPYPLIRPLLSIAGIALRDWLRARKLPWREDATNHDDSIPRNYVRNTLMPQLEHTWVPGIRARLCQSAETLREDDELLESLAARQLAGSSNGNDPTNMRLSVTELLQHPLALQRRILRQWLFRQSHDPATGLESIHALIAWCHTRGDWQRALHGDVLAVCRNGELSLHSSKTDSTFRPPDMLLTVPTPQPLRWGNAEISAIHSQGIFSFENGIGHFPAACTLSATALAGRQLQVRARHPGDRIAPTGMKGSKKIQDLFVDEKVPEEMRNLIPLLICDGEVVWVPGYRVARRFAVPAPDAPSVKVTVQPVR